VTCIFVDTPKECTTCIDCSQTRLQCLLNHRHLRVSEAGVKLLTRDLAVEIAGTSRYKEKAGQAGRR
jgi:hypothetical protein